MNNPDPSLRTDFNLWGWYYHRGKDHQKAIRYFNKALEVDPDYASALRGLGNIVMWSGIYYALAVTEKLRVEESDGTVRIGGAYYNPMDKIGGLGESLEEISTTA